MNWKHGVHILGGAIAVLAVYDMVAASSSNNLPAGPNIPTANPMTNLLVGGALFAVPFFI